MSPRRWLFVWITSVVIGLAAAHAEPGMEAKFLAENELAMNKMMAGMAVPASGDIDRDFVDMMVPHHQGAVDMARAELRYGHNEKLRRIAQEIIVDQLQEIDAMRLAVGEPPAAPAHDPEAAKSGNGSMSMKGTP
jgi:uncharacterized protein (DUF305 family)